MPLECYAVAVVFRCPCKASHTSDLLAMTHILYTSIRTTVTTAVVPSQGVPFGVGCGGHPSPTARKGWGPRDCSRRTDSLETTIILDLLQPFKVVAFTIMDDLFS